MQKLKSSITMIAVTLFTFITLISSVPAQPVSANSYDFLSAEALSACGFSNPNDFKVAVTKLAQKRVDDDRYYANGCIGFVMEVYHTTLMSKGGPNPDSPNYAKGVQAVNAFTHTNGQLWATVTGFMTDPEAKAIGNGGNAFETSNINNNLSARLQEFGAEEGDIIVLGGGMTEEDSWSCTVTYKTSRTDSQQTYTVRGYPTAAKATKAAQNWINHQPVASWAQSGGYVRLGEPKVHTTATTERPWGHIAIYQGTGTKVWQATFHYSSNSGSEAYEATLGNSSTGSKSYRKVLVLKVAGHTEPTPFHATGGKVILVSEWNDLVEAYGEQYVRQNVKFDVKVNQDTRVITDTGEDGLRGTDDDTYIDYAAGETIWSGDLTGITPTVIEISGYQYYQFILPSMPTNGVFVHADPSDESEISITVVETGSFNALFPT